MITQIHDIVKTLQDRAESAKENLRNEGPWLGETLEKALENYAEVQVTRPLQHVATISVEAKTSVC